ncbi:hypothetical protein [Streptomyces sp. JJ38]|uniref:hypothetical protein n=1 Tax=Streptomyces sp. JJ38 TaxID=2738128 RepID=UPI001C5804C8|nr:hypothetical protein [Streptomyces sp. JJ38]MBW1597896.1 hypothetical protein [Streptomyces sp. JJ38]
MTAGPGKGREPDEGSGLPEDEDELRRLLQDAVRDIEPSRDALDHLRHAVPVRRARRRHAMIGAATAVLVTAVTVPLMTTGVVPGPLAEDDRANAAHSTDAGSGKPYGGRDTTGAQGESSGDEGTGDGGAASRPSTSPSPDDTDGLGPSSPSCLRDQLGEPEAEVGKPDEDGVIHGAFRFTNVSGESCRVGAADQLSAKARGEADATAITVLDHTAGGRAPGLPEPPEVVKELILRPGESFQVRFAWMPDAERGPGGCPAPDAEPDPEPSEGGTSGGSETTGGSGGDDGGAQSGDGGTEGGEETTSGSTGGGGTEGGEQTATSSGSGPEQNEPSGLTTLSDTGTGSGEQVDEAEDEGAATAVILRYVPAAGEPSAPTAFLGGVCAGTVYRTGVLPVS